MSASGDPNLHELVIDRAEIWLLTTTLAKGDMRFGVIMETHELGAGTKKGSGKGSY